MQKNDELVGGQNFLFLFIYLIFWLKRKKVNPELKSINQLKKPREKTKRKDEQWYSHKNYASIYSKTRKSWHKKNTNEKQNFPKVFRL